MQTPKAIEIEQKIDELKVRFESYLRPMFDEWKREVPGVIREKILYPLFKINDDKTIDINFAKEVEYLLIINKVDHYVSIN